MAVSAKPIRDTLDMPATTDKTDSSTYLTRILCWNDLSFSFIFVEIVSHISLFTSNELYKFFLQKSLILSHTFCFIELQIDYFLDF